MGGCTNQASQGGGEGEAVSNSITCTKHGTFDVKRMPGAVTCPACQAERERQQWEAGWRARGEAVMEKLIEKRDFKFLLWVRSMPPPAAQPASEPAKEKP